MEAQPILHPSLPLSNPSSSFPMSMPPQMTHKQLAPSSSSQALPATPTHPSSSGATVNSKVFGSLLSSADGTYVPPGVSTLSTLNSLALSLAMRIAPVTVAHSAPHTAHFSEAGSYHPGAPAASAAPSTPVMHIHLDPDHMFPLSAPLHIPHHKRPGHPRLSGTPSQAQIFGLEEEEAAEVQGKWWHSTASGVLGGICCVYAGQPFDTIKVRLQTQSTVHRLYQSPLDCLRKTISQGGYRALYKGSSAALASVVLENAVLFTANSHVKETMKRLSANPEADLSLGQEALAGGIAGIFSSTAITPAEVIKCRLQIQDRLASGTIANAPMRYTGPVDAVIKTVRGEGLQGLFKGLPSLWMRDIPFNFVFLGSYEAFCLLSSRTLGKSREELGPAELFFCGGLAGVSGWSIIFPMDVVKSKVQTNAFPGASNLEVIRQTFRAGGIRAFYQGWSAAVMRAFPANAALLLGVEFSRRLFEEYS